MESPVLTPCGNVPSRPALKCQPLCVRTFLDDVNDIVGVEAELVGVLRVVGVERPALRHLRLGLGLRLGPSSGRRRAARGLPADTDQQQGLVGFGACDSNLSFSKPLCLNEFILKNITEQGKKDFLECHNN